MAATENSLSTGVTRNRTRKDPRDGGWPSNLRLVRPVLSAGSCLAHCLYQNFSAARNVFHAVLSSAPQRRRPAAAPAEQYASRLAGVTALGTAQRIAHQVPYRRRIVDRTQYILQAREAFQRFPRPLSLVQAGEEIRRRSGIS